MKHAVENIFEGLFKQYPELECCRNIIEKAFEVLKKCFENGGKVLICGNGGSAADSEHIVGELMKGFLLKRPISDADKEKLKAAFPEDSDYFSDKLQGALPAISLVSQLALSTALINDIGADMIFAQQVYGYAQQGDVLISISTSGNAKNVANAVMVARVMGAKTIGMTGGNGGLLQDLCDITIRVPPNETFKVQEYHLPVYHVLCAMIEEEFFGHKFI